jgi:hypothetical protein
MIFFVAPRDGMFGMEDYLRSDGAPLQDRLRVLAYDDIMARPELRVGTYIFSGLEQLSPTESDIVIRCRQELAQAVPGIVLLNDPAQVLHRYKLLRTAFELGRNAFSASRASEFFRGHHFPVFLRAEREHTGNLTPLLRTQWELDRALLLACLRGYRLRDLLVVEFCSTADSEGIFRKYSAFLVGERVVPFYLDLSRQWMIKWEQRITTESTAREEFEYVDQNPHEQWLRETFALARIDYGRMDYGVAGGRPQVFEINLNPTFVSRPGAVSALTLERRRLRARARERNIRQLQEALERLDSPEDPGRTIRIRVSEAERRKLEAEKRAIERLRARKTVVSQLVGPLARLVRPLFVP